ncbi:DUF3558 domain-containing protein [Speluncibacter jeojiensis]|uniref:DUF3558 domain-containing protein n=1 Tax=Speluncibacter jeojiensis TaxID=2710754 RepID=A0A9X4RDX9_9ACTN|nr:DUF3558 domain-containing protein [Corynebacteriales bacterium D3-21]
MALPLFAALALAACGQATTGQTWAVSDSSSAAPQSQATFDSGRPQIRFNPCKDLSPEIVAKAGYDPHKMEPSDFDGGTYKFLVCDLTSDLYSLGISSGSITLAEQESQQKRDSATKTVTPITVSGRAGFEARDPSRPNMCTLAFETSYGEVLFTRYQREKATDEGLDVCDGLQQTAATIAAVLPDGA